MSFVQHPLAPLSSCDPLRLAIVGPSSSGKTTLVNHILQRAHRIIRQAPPAQPSRSPNPILARLAGSRITTVLSRAFTFVHSLIKAFIPSAHADRHQFFSVPSEDDIADADIDGIGAVIVWDTDGRGGVQALQDMGDDIDVILFVTRLDDSRVNRQDKIILSHLIQCFGDEVLHKVVFILTHGHALPPLNLSYSDYIRGRTHLLAAAVRLCVRPVVIPSSETPSSSSAPQFVDETEHMTRQEQLQHASVMVHHSAIPTQHLDTGALSLFTHRPEQRAPEGEEIDPNDPYGELPRAVKKVFDVLGNDDDTDRGSVTGLDDTFLDELAGVGILPDDNRRFRDPLVPQALVVELSDACPVDDNGQKILPDGVAWFPELIHKIAQIATDAPAIIAEIKERKEVLREQTRQQVVQPQSQVHRQLRQMLTSLSRDGFRILLVEIGIIFFIWQVGSAVKYTKDRRRRLREQDESDVLLELSDEEFERLTRPDPGSGGKVVMGDVDDDDEVLLETEDEFFGRKAARKRDGEKGVPETPNIFQFIPKRTDNANGKPGGMERLGESGESTDDTPNRNGATEDDEESDQWHRLDGGSTPSNSSPGNSTMRIPEAPTGQKKKSRWGFGLLPEDEDWNIDEYRRRDEGLPDAKGDSSEPVPRTSEDEMGAEGIEPVTQQSKVASDSKAKLRGDSVSDNKESIKGLLDGDL